MEQIEETMEQIEETMEQIEETMGLKLKTVDPIQVRHATLNN